MRGTTEPKRAEEALSLNEQLFRAVIESIADCVLLWDPDYTCLYANEAAIRHIGATRDKVIGKNICDSMGHMPDSMSLWMRRIEQVIATGQVERVEDVSIIGSKEVWSESVISPLRNGMGSVYAVAIVYRDITESRHLMRELTGTKDFLDNILQSSTKYSIIGKDLNCRIVSWNEGARRNYGYTAEEIMGKDSSILHIPEDVESGAVAKLLEMAYRVGLAEREFLRVRKNGSRFPARVVVTRRNDASGSPVGYLLISSDISEKKQAEEQLRPTSQYAISLIEASLDPLVTISPEGKITDVNEATIKVTGVPRQELIGTDFSKYFTEPEIAREGFRRVFENGFITDYALTIRHRNGNLVEVLYNASVYTDTRGNVLGVFAAARDITERKRAEDQIKKAMADLERSNEELEKFAYVASHDLQEPLRMVSSYVQLLARRYEGRLDDDADEFIHYAVDGAARMQGLINDLLAFSRVGTRGSSFEPTDFESVFAEAIANLRIVLDENGAVVTHDSLPGIKADSTQMVQLFQNLIGNAVKFRSRDSVSIHVSANRGDDEWIFTVRDNGVGIAEEYFDRIFQVFQRLHGKTEYPGTGIGLAICKKIVERHGGRIWVKSEPGEGSTFYFTLPAEKTA